MKKIISWAGLSLLLFTAFNCSTPAYVEKDQNVNLGNYKTYMWVDTRASETDESKRATSYADIGVHNAVNAELGKWGWREVTSDPDAFISYDVLVERAVETQQNPVYTQPVSRYYFNYRTKRWSTLYYPSQFVGYDTYDKPVKNGTITITIMDAQNDKKIWQGWTTERLSSGIRDLDIKKSVSNIFKES